MKKQPKVHDNLDLLTDACNQAWKAFLAYGPVDDGRPEGDAFDEALTSMQAHAEAGGKYIRKELKQLRRLAASLDESLQLLAKIRYQSWPRGMGSVLAKLGVAADHFDEIIIEGDRALKAAGFKPSTLDSKETP